MLNEAVAPVEDAPGGLACGLSPHVLKCPAEPLCTAARRRSSEKSQVRVAYGVQSTGKGHLSRLLGLKPFFDRDGHELLVVASGYEDPPEYFLEAVSNCRYARVKGISYVGDGRGGVSKSGTGAAFLWNLPELLSSYRRVRELVRAFRPKIVVSDFDPITGSALVSPGIPRVGLSHQISLEIPGMYHPPGMAVDKFFALAVIKLFTLDLHHKLGCHFYPANDSCLPPIIRPSIRDAQPQNRGHIVVYHTLPGMLPEVKRYAAEHPDRRFIVYGYEGHEEGANIHFEPDRTRFASDLASADAYVGTAGFQSISEAFYLGKKIAVCPVGQQYEQLWNAAQLEYYGMGRWYRDSSVGSGTGLGSCTLETALEQQFNRELHRRLYPWFRDGAQSCYERIMSLASGSP